MFNRIKELLLALDQKLLVEDYDLNGKLLSRKVCGVTTYKIVELHEELWLP